ncbi:putative F-box protein At1g33530 [Spinacia oleracea]|uniref:F-box protein At1g33530 n=1 Tax=Spinacia oleracea TaxID=3562 RepID=A0ABM3QWS5_SPIOL|nr:putative F-box protein At1g33530 [Spinacia oleracea]
MTAAIGINDSNQKDKSDKCVGAENGVNEKMKGRWMFKCGLMLKVSIDCNMKNKTPKSEPRLQYPTLPDDIIVDHILPKLPVKSLIRFQSVSNYWHKTISSNKFAKKHLEFSSSNTRTILFHNSEDSYFLAYDECSSSLKAFAKLEYKLTPVKPPIPPEYEMSNLTYEVGSCNGLVLLRDSEDCCLYLWNPATNECYAISFPDVVYEFEVSPFLGFGIYLPSMTIG